MNIPHVGAVLALTACLALSACASEDPAPVPKDRVVETLEAGPVVVVDVLDDQPASTALKVPVEITDPAVAEDLFATMGQGGDTLRVVYDNAKRANPDEIWVQYLGSGCYTPDSVGVVLSPQDVPMLKPVYEKNKPKVQCFRAVPTVGVVSLS